MKGNPSNPFTQDPQHTKRDLPMPIQKAKVMAAGDHPDDNPFHTVRIRVYGDQATYMAPVITPMFGSIWVPKAGEDVAVMFGNNDKPFVIGVWYPVDLVDSGEVDLPDYEAGDIRLGNETGSHVTVHNDGHIEIVTGGHEVINIDHHAGSVYQGSNYTVTTTDNYEKVPFDTIKTDPEGMFDASTNSFNVQHDGEYGVWGQIDIDTAVDKTNYTLSIFVNDSLVKRKQQQGAKDAPLSIDVRAYEEFEKGDAIDIRFKTGSTSDTILEGSDIGTEFRIERTGI